MKIKIPSVLFAVLLFVSAFCMAGCENSSQAPEAFSVSIYKVEKEQDEDGNVYITDYALWESYNVTPAQAIDLPDYDPEIKDRDCKISYKGNYDNGSGGISGIINGKILECKNKIKFIPYAISMIFARERQKKTINFFYEGENISKSLNATQIETLNATFKDTYEETFNVNALIDWFNTFSINSSTQQRLTVQMYTKANNEKPFYQFSATRYYDSEWYVSDSYKFTLIKSTDVYLKVEITENGNSGYSATVLEEERLARESGYTSAG